MAVKIKVVEATGNFLNGWTPSEKVLLSKDLQDLQELALKLSRESYKHEKHSRQEKKKY